MIRRTKNVFVLSTPHTVYMFRVMPTGHLEHLYYGSALADYSSAADEDIEHDAFTLSEKRVFPEGNVISYDSAHPEVTLEDLCLEMSSYGKGDIRDPFVEITHADGSRTSDFLFEKAEITCSKEPFATLPGSYVYGTSYEPDEAEDTGKDAGAEHVFSESHVEESAASVKENDAGFSHLCVTLLDRHYGLTLELHYYVYEDCDVISRSARLVNTGAGTVRIDRLMSTQLDFAGNGLFLSTFTGAWAREMNRNDTPVTAGRIVNSTVAGVSSNRNNPFVMLHKEDTTECSGDCYGINLIYSGNHYESCGVNAFGKTRLLAGINPDGFSWELKAGEAFEAPEAVMTFSEEGYTIMSHRMHSFVRRHIVRGKWQYRPRPVLLNSWEAAYFKIDEGKLIRLARAAAEAGAELFVMDDGWFGERNDDTGSLGDWFVNKKKLPGGLSGIVHRVKELGMDFGLWIEPEMISVKSRLYDEHPDWAMDIPGNPHSEGRNERFLDLANPDVVNYMVETISAVLSSAEISYVKWDMNRIMSDVYSKYLPAERQGETAHRYILGFYRMADELTKRFPDILFEGCAAGGCRFDLGALCFFPQIWASDDTDALERVRIQEGYSYGYPMSVLTSHVSASPNHQTLREMPMDSRFNVASFGLLGYELNLCDLGKKELDEVRKQIALYKEWREVLQTGDFYRGRRENIHEWTCVSRDKKKAVGMIFQEKAVPNMQYEEYHAEGLDPEMRYHLYNIEQKRDIRNFGDLVNTASPVHVKPGSFLHDIIAKFVTMPGEQEEIYASGALLMKAGVKLLPGYSGTGYNDKTRYFADYCSRMYFMEADS